MDPPDYILLKSMAILAMVFVYYYCVAAIPNENRKWVGKQ
jgi:hypothetical protein